MRNIIYFCVFIAVLVAIVALNLFGFWGTIAFVILGLCGLAIAATLTVETRSALGVVCANIGSNNNYRLLVMAILTVCCFTMAIKSGPGTPLAATSLENIKKTISFQRNAGFQKIKNYILWGEDKTDNKISIAAGKPEQKRANHKSWFFWKLGAVFALLTCFYLPFAFADEVAGFFTNTADWIRQRNLELKQNPVVQATVKGATKATMSASGGGGTSKIGWFGRLYGSDLAAEFSVRLLQNFAKLFSRSTTI